MRTRSVKKLNNRGEAWTPIVKMLKAQTAGGNRSALVALAGLARMNKGLRKEVDIKNYKNSLEKELINKIKTGNRQAFQRAIQVLPARKYPEIHRLFYNARRNQLANKLFTNFGRVTNIENIGNGGRYVTTTTGRWAFYPRTQGPHQLLKQQANGNWHYHGSGMGPFNLRNGRLELANRGNNWNPPAPLAYHIDNFPI